MTTPRVTASRGATPRGTRPRGTLSQRIALLAVAVAIMTAVVAGVLATGLTRQAGERSARQTLSRLADAAQATADIGANAQAGQQRARRTLAAIGVQVATIGPGGRVSSASALARQALSAAEVADVRARGVVSARREVAGQDVFVEARGTDAGGIVLVQHQADALAVGDAAIRRTLLALVIAVVPATALSLAVATRMARPLRRAARAAHQLADGRRDVAVIPEGPAEVAEVAEAVNSLAAALTLSEARQRNFLLSVSHDLRTPLTAINGYAESLAEGVVTSAEVAEVGRVLLGEGRRLERLVGDLLDLARLQALHLRIDPQELDLVALGQATATVWRRRCAGEGVRFAYEAPGVPVPVRTDAARVRQVLDGLLENALRVTPAGAPIVLELRVVRVADGRGGAELEVRDGGPGLDDADLAVAFEPSALYERYRGVRQVGTGLGLAIVLGLVSRLGGTVEAGHAREGGARFTVRLPA